VNTDNNQPIRTWEDILRHATEEDIAAMRATDFTVDDVTSAVEVALWPPIPDGVDEATRELIEMLTDFCDRFIVLLGEAIDLLDATNPLGREMYTAIATYFDTIAEA